MEFVDRKKEFARVQTALQREKPQFIAVYGRRRIAVVTSISWQIRPQSQVSGSCSLLR